jgi:hypothetical protein
MAQDVEMLTVTSQVQVEAAVQMVAEYYGVDTRTAYRAWNKFGPDMPAPGVGGAAQSCYGVWQLWPSVPPLALGRPGSVVTTPRPAAYAILAAALPQRAGPGLATPPLCPSRDHLLGERDHDRAAAHHDGADHRLRRGGRLAAGRAAGVLNTAVVQSRSPFPSSSGNLAMLTAMRRASSAVSTFACIASVSVARLYTYAIAWPLASRTT